MPYELYALFDDRDPGHVRYIGFSKSAERRFVSHLKEAFNLPDKSYRLNWLRKVLAGNTLPLWRVLAIVATAQEAAELEIRAIESYLKCGHRLTNGTIGGEGVQGFGGHLTAEAIAKKIATYQTPEYLTNRSRNSRAYWASIEAREAQRAAMKAFWLTPESDELRRQYSEAAKKQYNSAVIHTPEAREKMRAAKLGKPHPRERTAEWNEKIGASQRGVERRKWTEEDHQRRRPTEETRAKMAASARARKIRPVEERMKELERRIAAEKAYLASLEGVKNGEEETK